MKIEMIVAASLDGYIAQDVSQSSLDWTSREDKIFFTRKSKEMKVIVMGENTFRTVEFEKISRGRIIIVLSEKPEEISGAKPLAEFDKELTAGLFAVKISARDLIAYLEECEVSQLLICGGVAVYKQFWQTGLVSKLYLTLEAVLFGSGMGLGGAIDMGEMQNMRIEKLEQLSEKTVLLEICPA